MMKKNIVCALCSAFIMLLLPWCAVTFAKGDGGMAICFLLLFVVNPIASISVGVFMGRRPTVAWFQPLVLSTLFLFGAWIFFDMGEVDFLLYAGAYLLIGYVTAAIVAFYTLLRKIKG